LGLIFVKETVDRFQRLPGGQSQAAFHKVLTIINFCPATSAQSWVSRREVFMIIAITEKRTTHRWVVQLDNLEVNFNGQEEAQAFVGQLKARINAPHTWPITAGRQVFDRQARGSHLAATID